MSGALPSRPMVTVLRVIADSEARIASPSDVPPPTVSGPTAANTVAWSAVGRAASRPPCWNATTPMSTRPGWALMNDGAACFAAPRRLGATSVRPCCPTSMARITVPEAWDTGTDAAGPATATASTATPAMVNHTPPGGCGGRGRSHPPRSRPRRGPPPGAARRRSRPTPGPRRRAGRRPGARGRRGSRAPAPGARDDLDERRGQVGVRADAVDGHPRRRIPAARRASRSPTPARSRARSSGSDESMTSCSRSRRLRRRPGRHRAADHGRHR